MANCNSDCSSCGQSCSERKGPEKAAQNVKSNVKKVIGVVSGKGGVGKSLVTSLLAVASGKKGFATAILDADITGPSIPTAFNVNRDQIESDGTTIWPAVSEAGTRVMSMNLLLPSDVDPVVWRGPVIAGAVKQFWTDVAWGDVDYMFVDMPPGTGDVPLTVFQSLPLAGIVIVTSPQELVSIIVQKAVKMAGMMNIPVLGIVENMSYFECPDCGKKHFIYGESHIEEIAAANCIDTIARIPINPEIARLVDEGRIEEFDKDYINPIIEKIIQ